MDPIQELVRNFQELVAQVPEFVQPFVVALAGAVPFIEGEGAGLVGVVGGINPIVAGIAAAIGNFIAVTIVVLAGARARRAVVGARTRRRQRVPEPVGAGSAAVTASEVDGTAAQAEVKPESKGRKRFRTWLVRFGVPGASLLGPLAIPTHFTAAMLVASGTSVRWVLLWQGIAIAVWTTVLTTFMWVVLSAVAA